MFANPSAAQKAANLLGLTLEELVQFTFHTTSAGGLVFARPSFRQTSSSPVAGEKMYSDNNIEPTEALEGLAQGLYVEAFSVLVALINKYMAKI